MGKAIYMFKVETNACSAAAQHGKACLQFRNVDFFLAVLLWTDVNCMYSRHCGLPARHCIARLHVRRRDGRTCWTFYFIFYSCFGLFSRFQQNRFLLRSFVLLLGLYFFHGYSLKTFVLSSLTLKKVHVYCCCRLFHMDHGFLQIDF